MKKRSVGNLCKNALGTVFLLAGAFFVCSTLLSMRAVFADPIGPVFGSNENAGAPVNVAQNRARGTNPRANATATTTNNKQKSARPTTNASANRAVASRSVVARPTNSGMTAARTATRNVVARTAANRTAAQTRNVRARTSSTARVGVSGDAIRGTKTTSGTTYTYLYNKLYTGNYSNIVDSTTGLISADAYNNCLESYYTCMDEICTARNQAQRRCACAGRVRAFAEAEAQLESANEELIKVSGELALLIANKGKEVSAAFSLTDAERVMNCASWREAAKYTASGTRSSACVEADMTTWCQSHGEYDSTQCSCTRSPSYCTNESVYGFNVENLDGAGSDILASLATWADQVKTNVDTILTDNNDAIEVATQTLVNEINSIVGSSAGLFDDGETDKLAETWGYELFKYAHNNICSRVLDSCFNGIYEGCGTPPTNGRCANGATSSCPFNYNSKITVTESGEVELNERGNSSGSSTTAACFGYGSSSSDPYASLRGPVADGRRSVMQKYLMDANADCDAYGEQLRATAQKIAYQKTAAQQALQQKRLEFYNEEQSSVLASATAAGTNFNECISELWDCYESTHASNTSWPLARVKTYCAQIANSPHCYQDMVCNPSYAQFRAIIDKADKTNCEWHASDYTANECRNVVTLNEILNYASQTPVANMPVEGQTYDSAGLREQCLRDTLGCNDDDPATGCIRKWRFNTESSGD